MVMSTVIALVLIMVAIVIGAAVTYFLSKSNYARIESGYEARLADRDAQIKSAELVRGQVEKLLPLEGEVVTLRQNLIEKQNELVLKAAEIGELLQEVNQERERNLELTKDQEAQEMLISAREEQLSDTEKRFQEEKKQLEDSFANLSKQALASAQNSFIELANEKFKDARQVSQQELDKVLSPMKDTLSRLGEHTRELENKRTESYATLTSQLNSLLTSTSQLSNALKRPEVRGNWGEMALQNAAEAAGLSKGIDFHMQVNLDTDNGRLRPDMVVNLPNQRKIVVDSKAPMDAYLTAIETDDPQLKALKLREHAVQFKARIKELSSKAYQGEFADTADFVVLFVPSEALYQVAITEDPNLLHMAFASKVVLANPMTLVALLRVVANGMQQQKAYENALQIAKLGGELHDSVSTFAGHYVGVGKAITSAMNKYNDSVGTLERNVISKGKKLRELGARAAKEIEDVEPIEGSIRAMSLATKNEKGEDAEASSLF
jgi:DNA recombination protein RmuC